MAGMMNEFTEILGTNESPFFFFLLAAKATPHPSTPVMMIYLYKMDPSNLARRCH